MVKGDICLAKFPLGGTIGVKVRPVLLLTGPLGSVPEFLTAYISSVIPPSLLPSDLMLDPSLPEFSGTKLKAASVLRLHKLASVHQRDVIRRLGKLAVVTIPHVDSRLRQLLSL